MNIHRHLLPALILTIFYPQANAQSGKMVGRTFDDAVVTDSASTMLIPFRYSASLLTFNKAMTWGNYYANFVVYDFKMDNYKLLFKEDTYIQADHPDYYNSFSQRKPYPYMTRKWIFYLVKNSDYNQNKKIDKYDPFILYASTPTGTELKSLTPVNEHVLNMTLYEPLGFALVKIRRDANNDGKFEGDEDTDYLIRLDLNDLHFGKPIETVAAKRP